MECKWGYSSYNGPDKWVQCYKILKKPRVGQSPIDIEGGSVVPAKHRLLRTNYTKAKARCTKISNNGHTFQVDCSPPDLDNPKDYNIRGGPLGPEGFSLAQFHFHWGKEDSYGSEHTRNGNAFAAEGHFVHFNKKYGSFSEAKGQPDGLAVTAVHYRVGNPNRGINQLLGALEHIEYKGKSYALEGGFHPRSLMPRPTFRQRFWSYRGSLTTPPCLETVHWIIFKRFQSISPEQLEAFRKLKSYCPVCTKPNPKDEYDGHIINNWRPVQARNFHTKNDDGEEEERERTVLHFHRRRIPESRKFQKEEEDSDSSSSSTSSSSSSDGEGEGSGDED